MSAYRRDFDETEYVSFFIKDDELLKKYNELWKSASKSIKKEFDSEFIYTEKHLKTKVNLITENWTKILTIIKYQKKILHLFFYQ